MRCLRTPRDGEDGSDEELPCAHRKQVECGERLGRDEPLRRDEAQDRHDRKHPRRRALAARHQRKKEQREHEIELLLDTEAPGVEQRLDFVREVPVPGGLEQQDVVRHAHGRDDALSEVLEVVRQHEQPAERDRDDDHGV